jgi:hypothetical protein
MELTDTGLVFHPDQFVYGVWFVPPDLAKPLEDQCDWLCCLWRELDQPLWFVRYRFRYRGSADPWDGTDTRNWTTFTRPASEPVQCVALDVNALAAVCALRFGTDVAFVSVNGDGEKALSLLHQQPWMHLKEVPSEST